MPTIATRTDSRAAIPSISDDGFETEVVQSDIPVLVDFSAEWCAPCRLMHGVLADLTVELQGRLRIVTVDVDQNPLHARQLGVRGMPSLFLFHKGQVVAHRAGAAPKVVVKRWVEDVLRQT